MLRLTRRPHPLLAFLASGARAASMAAPFFTTEGRLMRGAGADLTKQFVPVHKGMSLIQPAAGGGLEAALVSEAAARPYVDGATETLIGTAEEGAPLVFKTQRSVEFGADYEAVCLPAGFGE